MYINGLHIQLNYTKGKTYLRMTGAIEIHVNFYFEAVFVQF